MADFGHFGGSDEEYAEVKKLVAEVVRVFAHPSDFATHLALVACGRVR